MRTFSTIVLATIGWIGLSSISSPLNATIVSNFEITVDRSFDSDRLPPVGTKGFGTLTFDESQIQYNENNFFDPYARPPFGYYAQRPTSLSLDFFNRRYTQVNDSSIGRSTTYFSFNRTDTGSYQLKGFLVGTSDESSSLAISSNGFAAAFNNAGLAYGTVRLTSSEVIPEPSMIAGVPVALMFGWLSHQKLKRRRSKTIVLK
ncbi:MAG: hypothetical protein J0L70_27330 [Leptolyngbya sp. UWPOB_LEPTO1]|uniref:hypothetical protein n=1 Tax=Leptolyngbya sp. UWPOB_LEPTO1 TaxID=2815653 RepID=UPI001AC83537|nr:hypothetical protein [Leptolyngbya sp. UWPOB_LEPTO1]MBN8564251.1 hypothetical protein [Leptolyngbya sp. UWPOB_LEPTO1]